MPRPLLAAGLVGLLATPVTATDLAKLDRSVRTEPAYQSESPRYCLVVFGPEAATRVWLVLDGDALYVDRDGDGDLTEDGERVTLPAFKPSDHPFMDGEREVKLGSVQDGERTHTGLTFSQTRYRKTVGKLDADQVGKEGEWQAHLDEVNKQAPSGVAAMLTVQVAGSATEGTVNWFAWVDDRGHLQFAGSRASAPVIHFGGPLTMLVNPGSKLRPDPSLDEDITVHIGTEGVGAGSFAYSCCDRVPKGVFPVIEVEYPPAATGGTVRIRERHELKERC